jgi:hypothetical protein
VRVNGYKEGKKKKMRGERRGKENQKKKGN